MARRMWLEAAVVVAIGCRGTTPAPAPRVAPVVAPVPPPVAVAAIPIDAAPPPATLDAPGPALISDADCFAKGGHIEDEHTYEHMNRRPRDPDAPPPTPFRLCRIPSPMDGKACSSTSDCQGGQCLCTGKLNWPHEDDDPARMKADGTHGMGVCTEGPFQSGMWICEVEGGIIHVNGLIID